MCVWAITQQHCMDYYVEQTDLCSTYYKTADVTSRKHCHTGQKKSIFSLRLRCDISPIHLRTPIVSSIVRRTPDHWMAFHNVATFSLYFNLHSVPLNEKVDKSHYSVGDKRTS